MLRVVEQITEQTAEHSDQLMTPFMYMLIQEKLTLTDMGILMTAAVCHDLDHPGYNNT